MVPVVCQLLHDPVEVEVGIDPVSLLQLCPDPASLLVHAPAWRRTTAHPVLLSKQPSLPESASFGSPPRTAIRYFDGTQNIVLQRAVGGALTRSFGADDRGQVGAGRHSAG